MINNIKKQQFSRREFIQTSASVATTAAIASSITLPFTAQAASEPKIQPDEINETIKYSACLVN